jgi:L-cysteine:1D-myo-inositol 2-amino-2-deoxy-alpha-D-glucopyranoside ligase
VFVSELRKLWDPRAIRLAVIRHHYRHPWEWTGEAMPEAGDRLARWQAAAAGDGNGDAAIDAVRAALDDDLDVPTAVAAIDEVAELGKGVTRAAALLGVDLTRP